MADQKNRGGQKKSHQQPDQSEQKQGTTTEGTGERSDQERDALQLALSAEPGDLLLLVADERTTVRHILGLLRLELARPPIAEGGLHYLWITEFPLFEGVDEAGRPIPAHHPFTMPHPEDLDLLDTEPMRVRSSCRSSTSRSACRNRRFSGS